jgi:hypothetical protein
MGTTERDRRELRRLAHFGLLLEAAAADPECVSMDEAVGAAELGLDLLTDDDRRALDRALENRR